MSFESGENYSRFWWKTLFASATPLFFCLLLAWDTPLWGLGIDSHQYLDFARLFYHFRTWLYEFRDGPAELLSGYALRTPLYPFILSLGLRASPDDLKFAVLISHLSIALISMMTVLRFMKDLVSGKWLIAGYLALAWINRDFLLTIGTEWCSAFLLTIHFALTASLCRERASSSKIIFLLSLLTSLLILLRPAFLPLLLVTLGTALLFSLFPRKKVLGLFLLGQTPLFLWLSINFLRFGSITLAPIGGITSWALISLLGPVPIKEGYSPPAREMIEYINPRIQFASPGEFSANFGVGGSSGTASFMQKAWVNSDLVQSHAAVLEIGPGALDHVLREFLLDSLIHHKDRYFEYLRSLWSTLAFSLLFAIPCVFIPWYSWKSRAKREIEVAGIASFVMHFLVIGGISLAHPLLTRYFAPTFSLLVFATIIFIGDFLKRFGGRPLSEAASEQVRGSRGIDE